MSEKNSKFRYFYVFLTEKHNVGNRSNHTPQHITLVPPFLADEHVVLEVSKQVSSQFNPFEIKLNGQTMIGPKKNILVISIEPNKYLQAVHEALFDGLDKQYINTGYTRYIRGEFTPHITLKKYHPIINENKSMIFDHIAVIHKYKNIKTILAINKLGK